MIINEIPAHAPLTGSRERSSAPVRLQMYLLINVCKSIENQTFLENMNEFLELFQLNNYGTRGSQLAKFKDKAYVYFNSLLKNAVAGLALCKSEAPRENLRISADEVLRFFTGSILEPPGGFPKPILIHLDPNFNSPKISTCALNATFLLD